MKYLLQKYSDEYYVITNDDADYKAGTIEPLKLGLGSQKVSVRNDNGKEIAVVNSINKAIPALAAHYEENPPQWEGDDDRIQDLGYGPAPTHCLARFVKETQFGVLWVKQMKPGQWFAYRNDQELSVRDKIAIFATCEEAQRAADAHVRDGYPNTEIINDGFSWLPEADIDWRTCPYRVAARARLAVYARA
jgi:hypothetical protein